MAIMRLLRRFALIASCHCERPKGASQSHSHGDQRNNFAITTQTASARNDKITNPELSEIKELYDLTAFKCERVANPRHDLTTSKNNGIAFGVFDNAFTDRVEQKVLHFCFKAGAEYD